MTQRVALVTGAMGGLGTAICQELAKAGHKVVASYHPQFDNKDAWLAEMAEAGFKDFVCVAGDVSSLEDCQKMVAEAEAACGQVDILINNAGMGSAVPATRETPEQFRSIVDVNLHGSYWMAQACGRVMQPGSAIINISSILGITTAALPQAAYAAAKAGVIGLTRDLAQQWGSRKGIRVNALAPGFFQTEMTDEYLPGYLESQFPRIPLGSMGDARQLAATAVWLASPAGGYVTGQTIAVDGGLTIT